MINIGINITVDSIAIAKIEKKGNGYLLKDFKSADIKDSIKPSLTEPNIISAQLLKEKLTNLLSNKKLHASLSIPDISIKTALLELESIPKKSGELERLIRWRMEKSLPFSVEDAKISYQIIKINGAENNNSILVSIIKKDVLHQYEELLRESGIEPIYINCSSFHVFNLYHDFMMKEAEDSQNFIFLHYVDNTLSVMIFRKGCPDFIRIKALRIEKGDIKKIKSELLASLKFYSHSRDISDLKYIYYCADTNIAADEFIEDMKIKRLGIEQMPWYEPEREGNSFVPPLKKGDTGGFKESGEGGLLYLLPAIGAAMEIR